MTKIIPSEFMRNLRPEYYSDSEGRMLYVLNAAQLEAHLGNITARNETHNFELFCRKLCERAISPNLRPQTGPEGGGDSKADSETYPVSSEISATYITDITGGDERWAFAFSAKKTWKPKVKSDVLGLVGTGRIYDRIICVTSQFARAKDRAKLEDDLTKAHGVPVTIHDRSWIIKEVIENDRKDLAYNYLNVGEIRTDEKHLGPSDYSRAQQLDDIEKDIDVPDNSPGAPVQRAASSLVAAKLSRNMERPRVDTDGRFMRAIRMANAGGTYRQKLEAQYEHIWTAFWWFDDFAFLNFGYDAFEQQSALVDHVKNFEFQCNLLQILFNAVIHGHLTRAEAKLDERAERVKARLEAWANDGSRPNNALEAKLYLLHMRLNFHALNENGDDLSDVWSGFSALLDDAAHLGEFDSDSAVKIIELAEVFAGDDPAYNDLIEKLASFVGKRKSEAEGALILLKRARKLTFASNFEMIRLLGRAAHGLSKREYQDSLIEALQTLTLAYRSAGLLWAARATCIFVATALLIEGEENSQLPVSFVPTMKILAWLALELKHIPDLFLAISLLRGALASLPLDEASQERVRENLRELDQFFAGVILHTPDEQLSDLQKLPDVIEKLELGISSTAILYTLGYYEDLRADGSFPHDTTEFEIQKMFSLLYSQPAIIRVAGGLNLNSSDAHSLSTHVLGMEVSIQISGSTNSILLAEATLSGLEAFFSTFLERHVVAHTEKVALTVLEIDADASPTFHFNKLTMSGEIKWPANRSPSSFEYFSETKDLLFKICATILGDSCVAKDMIQLVESMFRNEGLQERMAVVSTAGNSYSRLTSKPLSRLEDFDKYVEKTYPPRPLRPKLELLELPSIAGDDEIDAKSEEDMRHPKKHSDISVRSIIDVHSWDKASWKGIAYLQAPVGPITMALMYADETGAHAIFERWRERFGEEDAKDDIAITFIQELPNLPSAHYCVVICGRLPETGTKETLIFLSRSKIMTPDSTLNFDRFYRDFLRDGTFALQPAVLKDGVPVFLHGLSLIKRSLSVRKFADISKTDPEFVALMQHFPELRDA